MNEESAALVRLLDEQPDVELVLLFGSFATPAQRADSDLDLEVLCRDPRGRTVPMSAERKQTLIEALATLTGRAIDLVDLAAAGIPLLGVVLTTGRTLVEKRNGSRAECLVRYLIDAADFMPLYERTLRERRAAWIGS